MKIVKIIGGLGNQMFQYAFYVSLLSKGFSAKIDISTFRNYTLHNGYELSEIFKLNEQEQIATTNELNCYKDNKSLFKFRKFLGRLFFGDANRFIKDSHLIEINYSGYYPIHYNHSNEYLEGYWQNERYFIDIKQEIIRCYSWKIVNKDNLKLARRMSKENAVSVHIRRLDKPRSIKELLFRIKLSFVWRTCSKSYYLESIQRMNKVVHSPVYYIFTDNIKWVKHNIKLEPNFTIVDWNRGKDSNQDMYLMSKCKHNIISMSSFSWWGAWLNQDPSKIVIAPNRWAVRFEKEKGVIPNNWIRL